MEVVVVVVVAVIEVKVIVNVVVWVVWVVVIVVAAASNTYQQGLRKAHESSQEDPREPFLGEQASFKRFCLKPERLHPG